jgi:hypothetical protein
MAAIARDFRFARSRFFAKLATIFFTHRWDTNAQQVRTLIGFLGRSHFFSLIPIVLKRRREAEAQSLPL